MKPRGPCHSAALRGLISMHLAIVLAVITAGVGTLAYAWCHAQAVKNGEPALVAHHLEKHVATPAPTQ